MNPLKACPPAVAALSLLTALYAFQQPFRQYPGVEYGDFPLPADYQVQSEWTFARLIYPPVSGGYGHGFGRGFSGYYGRYGGLDWTHGNSIWTQD